MLATTPVTGAAGGGGERKLESSYIHKVCDSKLFSLHFKRRADEIHYNCLVPIYVFPEVKQNYKVLPPNFHIHVSVSDLYIPSIALFILLQPNRQTDPGNI
jgi:hypothetical protein